MPRRSRSSAQLKQPDWSKLVDGRAVVGANVRLRRKALGLSQERLADAAGLHWTYVGSVERGERNVSVDNIARLACALSVDIRDLFDPVVPGTPSVARQVSGTRKVHPRLR